MVFEIKGHKVSAQDYFAYEVDQLVEPKGMYVRKSTLHEDIWNVFHGSKPRNKNEDAWNHHVAKLHMPSQMAKAEDIVVDHVEHHHIASKQLDKAVESLVEPKKAPLMTLTTVQTRPWNINTTKDVTIEQLLEHKDSASWKFNRIRHLFTNYEEEMDAAKTYEDKIETIEKNVSIALRLVEEKEPNMYLQRLIRLAAGHWKAYKVAEVEEEHNTPSFDIYPADFLNLRNSEGQADIVEELVNSLRLKNIEVTVHQRTEEPFVSIQIERNSSTYSVAASKKEGKFFAKNYEFYQSVEAEASTLSELLLKLDK